MRRSFGDRVNKPTSESKLRIIGSTTTRALRWSARGALLGASCGSVYGLLFAVLGALLDGDPSKIPLTTLYFGLSGVAAGLLVGSFGAVIGYDADSLPDDDRNVAEPASSQHRVARDIASANRLQPVTRLADLPAADRRRIESVASRNPSRN
jgi:hypothetical protein